MLSGLMGALLTTSKSSYVVGERPTYLITGAEPGAVIFWTSWKDGKQWEYRGQYDQYIEADGTALIVWADPWYTSNIGTWKKQVDLLTPDGVWDTATVTFTVGAAGVTVPAPAPILVSPQPAPILSPLQPISPPALPPIPPRGTVEPLPLVRPPLPTPDILNPAPTPVPTTPVPIPAPTNGQVPPRSLYPIGQEPRPPIYRGDPTVPGSGDIYRPIVTAPPDILNPAPLPSLPSPLPAPIPAELPVYGPPPAAYQPIPQPAPAPGQDIGDALGGSVKFGSYDIPVWAIGLVALFLLKGR